MTDSSSGIDTQAEEALIDARRKIAGQPLGERSWALAFSGGGIRSATFCLGLARALARNGLLKRIDYLSTVSGGGYIGSAIGRLYSPKADATRVSDGLADDRSLFLWWLRNNGRFLLPAGLGDAVQAGASYIRGTLATHIEVGVLALLLSCVAILPHMLMLLFEPLRVWGSTLINPWWSLLPLAAFAGLSLLSAYWSAREENDPSGRNSLWSGALLILSLLLYFCATQRSGPDTDTDPTFWVLTIVAAVLLSGPAGGLIRLLYPKVAHWRRSRNPALTAHKLVPAQIRLGLTAWFSKVLVFSVLAFGLGLIDLLTWMVASKLSRLTADVYASVVGITAVVVLVLRTVVPTIQKYLAEPDQGPRLMQLLNAGGLLLTVLVLVLWLIAAQWFVYFLPVSPGDALCGSMNLGCALSPLDLLDSVFGRWGLLVAILAVYALMTGPNAEQINRSSLHPFYRSRLARAYVSVGNSPDHPTNEEDRRFKDSPLARAEASNIEHIGKVGEFRQGDDVELKQYRPYESGGPIHLINCCINQTVDDRTGNFNADRKGVNLAVSALGVEIGTQMPHDDGVIGDTGVAQWVAISGAAAGPGMGSASRFGLSALSFLTGVRLGFWWTRNTAKYPRNPLGKYTATLREWFGKFPGLNSSPLYISDGGHFDNTGIYALLKRKPERIIAADCGADPDYLFGDIENLIRKARIDYDIRIDFINPESVKDDPAVKGNPQMEADLLLFGTPDSISREPQRDFLMFARVDYGNNQAGHIIFVKPRRVFSLPLDLAGYADRDQEFPQQTTADQFFDEAQWESYCELGKRLGLCINDDLLKLVPVLQGGAIAEPSNLPGDALTEERKESGSRRQRLTATVGKTLGAGAAASLLVVGWQAWQDTQTALVQARDGQDAAVKALLTEVRDGLGSALEELRIEPDSLQEDAEPTPPQADAEPGTQQADAGAGTQQADAEPDAKKEDAELAAEKEDGETKARKALAAWVPAIESIGTKHGDSARNNAFDRVLSMVYENCRSVAEDDTTMQDEQSTFCSIVLATLSSPRASPWNAAQQQYWSQAVMLPTKKNAAGDCAPHEGLRRKLVIHSADSQSERIESIMKAAAGVGMDARVRTPNVQSQAMAERAMNAVSFVQPTLLAMYPDGLCQGELIDAISSEAKEVRPVDFSVPGFEHTTGTLHLWLPKADEPQAPGLADMVGTAQPDTQINDVVATMGSDHIVESAVKAPSNPGQAEDEASLEGDYVVKVWFRGSFTRTQVDAYRARLALPGDHPKLSFHVQRAVRDGGKYNSIVRYSGAKNSAVAKNVQRRTNEILAGMGCTLTPPLALNDEAASGPPGQGATEESEKVIEVWISQPSCAPRSSLSSSSR